MVLFQYFYYPRPRPRFSELRFVFCGVVLGASLLYLLDGLPVVFSGLQWPLVTATDFQLI
jgi:hypothetical protein